MTAATEATGVAGSVRIERLRAAVSDAGLDAFIATADESIAYLTGFRPLQLERLFAVVVSAKEAGGVLVPKLDLGQVAGAPDVLERSSYDASSDGLPELSALLGGAHRVGVEEDHIVFARSAALAGRGLGARACGKHHRRPEGAKGRGRDRGRSPCLRAHRTVVCVRVEPPAAGDLGARAEREDRGLPTRRGRLRFALAGPVRPERRQPARRPDRERAAGGRRRLRRYLGLPRRILGRSHPLCHGWAAVGLGSRGLGSRPRRAGGRDREVCPRQGCPLGTSSSRGA